MVKQTIIIQCFSCNKHFVNHTMKKIYRLISQEDGFIKKPIYICQGCNEKLEKYKFIEESNKERKKNLKRIVKEIRKKRI